MSENLTLLIIDIQCGLLKRQVHKKQFLKRKHR